MHVICLIVPAERRDLLFQLKHIFFLIIRAGNILKNAFFEEKCRKKNFWRKIRRMQFASCLETRSKSVIDNRIFYNRSVIENFEIVL